MSPNVKRVLGESNAYDAKDLMLRFMPNKVFVLAVRGTDYTLFNAVFSSEAKAFWFAYNWAWRGMEEEQPDWSEHAPPDPDPSDIPALKAFVTRYTQDRNLTVDVTELPVDPEFNSDN